MSNAIATHRKRKTDMKFIVTADKIPAIKAEHYEIVIANCRDRAKAIELAKQKIKELDRQIEELKAEKRKLNSDRYALARWLEAQPANTGPVKAFSKGSRAASGCFAGTSSGDAIGAAHTT